MSTKAEHTPGPYEVKYGGLSGDDYFVITSAVSPGVVCEYTVPVPRPSKEIVANARLFAAAPDLLAACEHAFRLMKERGDPFTGNDWEIGHRLSAAIAKAKGGAA